MILIATCGRCHVAYQLSNSRCKLRSKEEKPWPRNKKKSLTFSPVTWLTPSLTLPILPAPSVFVNCHSPKVLRLLAPWMTVCCCCLEAGGPCSPAPPPLTAADGAFLRDPSRGSCPSVAVPPVLRPLVEILVCLEGGCESVEGARAAAADAEDRRLASLAREGEGAAPLEVDRSVAPFGRLDEMTPTPTPLPGAAAADEARYRSDGRRAGGGPIAEASADWKAAPP